ncbi:MOP flippase family protein [Methylophilus flavus]|uniref:MOP flippase family protein n=1 Tax=Methylophilus flavus TaxID=640084 RepID=A0ABW3PBA8_9PROT
MTLRKKAFTSIRWTALSSSVKILVQLSQLVILSRLLTPADFGLIAIALATVAFIQIFADAGVSNAIIHFQEISNDQLSSLYWLNVSLGAILATVLVGASSFIADWYRQPELVNLLYIAALTLFINALGQQLRVNAQKNLLFSPLVKIELSAVLSGFLLSLILALYGWGVYSIALGTLLTAIIYCLFAWIFLANGWKPKLHLKIAEITKFLQYGSYMIGNNLVSTVNAQIDILIGGRIFGANDIGLYNVPKTLMLNVQMAINPIITQVGLPVMAIAQNDKNRLKNIYLKTILLTSSINFPIYLGIAFYSSEIVHLVLGEKWEDSIPLIKIFAIWGLVRSIGNPVGSLLLGVGRADMLFRWNLFWTIITGPSLWLGSYWGIYGMAIALAILMTLAYLPNWHFLVKPACGANLKEYSAQSAIPLILAVIATTLSYCITIPLGDALYRLTLGLFVAAILYLLLSITFNKPIIRYSLELLAISKK